MKHLAKINVCTATCGYIKEPNLLLSLVFHHQHVGRTAFLDKIKGVMCSDPRFLGSTTPVINAFVLHSFNVSPHINPMIELPPFNESHHSGMLPNYETFPDSKKFCIINNLKGGGNAKWLKTRVRFQK